MAVSVLEHLDREEELHDCCAYGFNDWLLHVAPVALVSFSPRPIDLNRNRLFLFRGSNDFCTSYPSDNKAPATKSVNGDLGALSTALARLRAVSERCLRWWRKHQEIITANRV